MDDATASDNCGEVTIEVSSETIAGMLQATTPFGTFTATDDAGNSTLLPRPSQFRTPQLLSSLRPSRLHVECSDEMPMDDALAQTTAVRMIMSSETTGMLRQSTPSCARSLRPCWKQAQLPRPSQ